MGEHIMSKTPAIKSIFLAAIALQLLQNGSATSFGNPFDEPKLDSYSCTLTVTRESKTLPSSEFLVLSAGRTRAQGPGDTVAITERGRVLLLNTAAKTATLFGDATSIPAGPAPPDFLVSIKRVAEDEGKSVPEKQIGATTAKGFEIDQGGMTGAVYVDPKTDFPVEFDLVNAGRTEKSVYSDFHFDLQLDPALFSTTPPAGYQLIHPSPPKATELGENVIPVLRAYAEHGDGTFPPQLGDWADLIKVMFKNAVPSTNPSKTDAEMQKLIVDMGTASEQLGILKRGAQWDYLPDAAKLGNGSKIVFWYQPKDLRDYKAVFGDLHVETVPLDRLPAAPTQ
jgi:hypothetical protein